MGTAEPDLILKQFLVLLGASLYVVVVAYLVVVVIAKVTVTGGVAAGCCGCQCS